LQIDKQRKYVKKSSYLFIPPYIEISMKIARHKYLIFGIITFAITAIQRLVDAIGYPLPLAFFNLPLIATIVFHLLYFKQIFTAGNVYNVEKLFMRLTKVGLVCLFVTFVPSVLNYFDFAPKVIQFFELLGFYGFMFFTTYLLMGFYKLSLLNDSQLSRRNWDLFMILLFAVALMYLKSAFLPNVYMGLIGLACFIVGLPLVFKIKWIAFINMKMRWLSVLFLLSILFLGLGIAQFSFHYNLPNYLNDTPGCICFVVILIFELAYILVSILALLFNMPIASITEKLAEEVKSIQQINQSVISRAPIEDTFNLLFTRCYKDTEANAGWMILEKDEHAENVTFYTGSAFEREVTYYNKTLKIKQKALEFPNKSYHYFGNLGEHISLKKFDRYQSLLVFPVFTKEKFQGAVCLLKKETDSFDEYQIQLAQSYVDQVQLAFENQELVKASIASERVKKEMEIARDVQRQLLPMDFPESTHFEMTAFCESLLEVGGDYYDFIMLDNNRLVLIIADVSGSGASAAFYMAHLKGVFQSLAQLNFPVAMFLECANEALSRCLAKRVFITLTYSLFDFGKKKLIYGRAGHTPLLFYDCEQQKAMYFEDKGLGLGIIRDETYGKFVKQYEKKFNSGDVFVLFTDGIIEGRDKTTKMEYGLERLRKVVEENAKLSVDNLKSTILKEVYDYLGTQKIPDDHTVIVVKIK